MRMTLIIVDRYSQPATLKHIKNHYQQRGISMPKNDAPKTLFATSVMSAAMHGALGEMEDYFDESQYIQHLPKDHKTPNMH